MGGEKCGLGKTLMQLEGSPPRGRGKAVIFHIHDECVRITPAWAGKRSARCGRWPGPLDHPRVGGEKPGNGWSFGCSGGSPPRGRGKASPCRSSSSGRRITPAWAGERLKRSHRSGIFISGPIPFHSVLHRPAGSGGSRAGRDGSPAGQPQNTGPA